jgi:hypothetical protein
MGEKYEYAYVQGELTVQTDESGEMYVERSRLKRIFWMGLALSIAALLVFMLLLTEGIFTRVVWGVAILVLVGGAVVEPILGGTRSEVKESEDAVYVELIPVSRSMVAAGGIMAIWWALAMLLRLVDPGGAAGYARTTGWILSLAELIPFGGPILGGLGLLVAYGMFQVVRSGYTEIEPA